MSTDPTYSARVAAEIRAEMARRSPRLTGRALCEVLDLGPKSVSRRLNGETSFDLDELHKVAAWLELPIEVLLHPAERAVTAA